MQFTGQLQDKDTGNRGGTDKLPPKSKREEWIRAFAVYASILFVLFATVLAYQYLHSELSLGGPGNSGSGSLEG